MREGICIEFQCPSSTAIMSGVLQDRRKMNMFSVFEDIVALKMSSSQIILIAQLPLSIYILEEAPMFE